MTDLCGLDARGYAVLPNVLSADECSELAAMYDEPTHWRKKIDMARHRFGSGEYQYFSYPLPASVQGVRERFYAPLAEIANAWSERLGGVARYPATLEEFLGRCHAAGQTRPTPLVLRYGEGDFNCLHQDVYGEHTFPLQLMVMLSSASEYEGGEFLLVENIPRAQSRGTAVRLEQGDAIVWPVRERPVRGARGDYRVSVRHGVSEVRRGHRHTLGVIFHDAA